MELWILISIFGAFLQNVRSALQKQLKVKLSTTGATFVRFGYGFPLAILYVGILHLQYSKPIPEFSFNFTTYTTIGGISQILATYLLVSLFSMRNFAISTAFSKTEPVQAAIIGFLILGDSVSIYGLVAICIAICGVFVATLARVDGNRISLTNFISNKSVWIGLLSGMFFGISGVSYRGASLSLVGSDFVMCAAFTLAVVIVFQTALMLVYIWIFERNQISKVLRAWKLAIFVGISGVSASACWFTAMSIQNAAYVKAVGQVELVFTFLVSWFIFKERISMLEFLGIGLISVGILVLMLT